MMMSIKHAIGEAADTILLADAAASAEAIREKVRKSERENILRLARAASQDDGPEKESELAQLTNWILAIKNA